MDSSNAERLLPLSAVTDRTSLKRSSIYDKMSAGEFPRAIKVSANRIAWPESAINAWIASKVAEAA